MSRDSVIARAQAAAERGMVDTCTVRRRTDANDSTVTDSSGVVTPTWSTVYTGVCRVQQPTATSQKDTPGEDFQLRLRLELQLPVSATGFQVGDEVTINTSRDPDMVGRVLLVWDLAHKTDLSSRRIGLTERTD